MNPRSFNPRALLLVAALAAAGAGAQTSDSATADTAATPESNSSRSYAPCSTLEGAALTDCLKQTTTWANAAKDSNIATITSRTMLDSSTSATTPKARPVDKTSPKANSVDNKFRAELRRCVQLPSDLRDNCLDGVIENRAQS